MKHVTALCLFLVLGCAGGQNYESNSYQSDRSDPKYQQRKNFYNDPTSQDGGTAVVGLVATGINLATNRDYYKSNAITGRCVCRNQKEDSIEFPCLNVEVIITDMKGHELAHLQSSTGDFAVRVQKNVPYKIKIVSSKFEPESPISRELYLGEDVIFRLVRK